MFGLLVKVVGSSAIAGSVAGSSQLRQKSDVEQEIANFCRFKKLVVLTQF